MQGGGWGHAAGLAPRPASLSRSLRHDRNLGRHCCGEKAVVLSFSLMLSFSSLRPCIELGSDSCGEFRFKCFFQMPIITTNAWFRFQVWTVALTPLVLVSSVVWVPLVVSGA
jgi:hypothetical protein